MLQLQKAVCFRSVFFYIIISALIGCSSGTSNNNSGVQSPGGPNPVDITIDSTGKNVYVLNNGSEDISHYIILPDGTLSLKSITAHLARLSSPAAIIAHPSNNYIYVVNRLDHNISQFVIGADGELTPNLTAATVAAGMYPTAINIHPSGKYAYVKVGKDLDPTTIESDILLYTIQSDGSLLLNDTVPLVKAVGAMGITFTPSGQFAYTYNTYHASVSQFTVASDGALSTNPNVASVSLNSPSNIVIHPSGKYAYMASGYNPGNRIMQYVVDVDGTLIPNSISSGIDTANDPLFVAIHPSGNFLFVVNYPNQNISQYIIASDGTLTVNESATTVTSGIGPVAVAIDPTGNFMYVVNNGGSNSYISQFAIEQNGTLTPL